MSVPFGKRQYLFCGNDKKDGIIYCKYRACKFHEKCLEKYKEKKEEFYKNSISKIKKRENFETKNCGLKIKLKIRPESPLMNSPFFRDSEIFR